MVRSLKVGWRVGTGGSREVTTTIQCETGGGEDVSDSTGDLKIDPKDMERKGRANEAPRFLSCSRGKDGVVRNREDRNYRRSRLRQISSISAM